MGVEKRLERVVVLGVDDGVEWLVSPTFDLASGDEAGVDRVAELRDNNQILNSYGALVYRIVDSDNVSPALPVLGIDLGDEEKTLILLLGRLPPVGKDAHLVVLADRPPGQLDGLRRVALEVQAEGAALRECVCFALEVFGQLGVLVGDLAKEIVEA